jgi:hypothetical protein
MSKPIGSGSQGTRRTGSWNKVKAIKVAASITGAIWHAKGKPDFLKDVVLTAETRREHLTVGFPGQNKRAVFEPNRIVIETTDGTLIDARDDPEKSFEGQQRETPWDDIHVSSGVASVLHERDEAVINDLVKRIRRTRDSQSETPTDGGSE